jgi:hypothetical protein
MNFVKLHLSNIKDNYEEIIKDNNMITVILGSPGSGKTRLMEYIGKNYNGYFLRIVDFMYFYDVNEIINELNGKNILLLDGFDEYRTNINNKSQSLRKFAKKLKNLIEKVDVKIIISCRELDWYGDKDDTALKNYLNKDVKEFKILPLDEEQINEFCEIKNIKDKKRFKEKFLKKGFLQTPQLFNISATLEKENISNKIELFEKFIIKAIKEENEEHKRLNLSNEEIFNYLGYLAFVFMFSDIKEFSDEILELISTEEYKIEILNKLVNNGKIFFNKAFIHRTIAEFLLGRYINFLLKEKGFNKTVIIDKFKNDYSIYTELRGSFAWLCSISGDFELIKIDPYYQLIYGENNHFSIEFKKKILEAIKEYSNKNPYFFRIDDYFAKDELRGFYTQELDEFMEEEIEEAAELKNHYLFIYDLILSSNKETISQEMKKFLFKKIKEGIFPEDFTVHILKNLNYSEQDYKELLKYIQENKLKDENNRIRIEILNHIYPNNFSIDELIEILKEFNPTNFWNYCDFLYKTENNKKIELVEKLEKEIMQDYRKEYYNNINNYEKIWRYKCIVEFLSHFYYELIHSYNGSNAKYIFYVLKKMYQYYEDFQTFELKYSYRSKIKKLSDNELQELSDKLFECYFLDKLNNNNLDYIFVEHFKYFFPLKFPKVSKILLNYLKKNINNLNQEILELFLKKIVQYKKYENDFEKQLQDFIKENGLERIYEKVITPVKIEKSEELAKLEKKLKEQEDSVKQWRKEVEEYYTKIDKDSFFNNLEDLKFVSTIFYMKEDNNWNFTNRIKEFLKEFIFCSNYDKYIKVENLLRNIENEREFSFDEALFVSFYLNENYEKVLKKLSQEKIKYLYLLTLYKNIPLNTLTSKRFIIFSQDKTFAKEALIDVFKYYNLYNTLKNYLEDSKIPLLKLIVERAFYKLNKKNLIDSFLKEFHLTVSIDILEELNKRTSTKLLEIIIKLKKYNLLTQDELIYFFKEVFDIRNNYQFFKKLSFEDKTFLSFNFMKIFDDDFKLKSVNGLQSDYHLVSNFVSSNLLKLLSKKEMEELLKKDISLYWKKLLGSEIYKRDSMENNEKIKIIELKNFIKEKGFFK